MRIRTLLFFAITSGLIAAHYLGSNRFCYRDLKFMKDEDFKRIAASIEASRNLVQPSIRAKTLTEFINEFPSCCSAAIDKSTQSILFTLIGGVKTYTSVKYIADEGGRKIKYYVTNLHDSCGTSVEQWEETQPLDG